MRSSCMKGRPRSWKGVPCRLWPAWRWHWSASAAARGGRRDDGAGDDASGEAQGARPACRVEWVGFRLGMGGELIEWLEVCGARHAIQWPWCGAAA